MGTDIIGVALGLLTVLVLTDISLRVVSVINNIKMNDKIVKEVLEKQGEQIADKMVAMVLNSTDIGIGSKRN